MAFPSFSPTRCHVNLAAVQRNFRRCGDPRFLMPVLKSDAYGHGQMEVAHALADVGAQRFATGTVDEGQRLRENGMTQGIMSLMAPVTDTDWECAATHRITPLVGCLEQVERAMAHATADRPIHLAVKLETGMHRQGFREEELDALTALLENAEHVRPVFAVSHCSCADIPERSAWTARQTSLFARMAARLADRFPGLETSLYNSAGTIDTHIHCALKDVSRPGIVLYGGNPFAGTSMERLGGDFEWAMSLETSILQVTELRRGEAVSYGQLFVADRDMRLAVAAAGYANAVPRALTHRLEALVHGRRVHSVGRVCMNMTMFDVTDIPDVVAGDSLWLWGGPAAEGVQPVTPQEWAAHLDTIPYEPLCLVGCVNRRDHNMDGEPFSL